MGMQSIVSASSSQLRVQRLGHALAGCDTHTAITVPWYLRSRALAGCVILAPTKKTQDLCFVSFRETSLCPGRFDSALPDLAGSSVVRVVQKTDDMDEVGALGEASKKENNLSVHICSHSFSRRQLAGVVVIEEISSPFVLGVRRAVRRLVHKTLVDELVCENKALRIHR
jgi:hypothetical protein